MAATATLAVKAAKVEPGSEVVCEIRIRNTGQIVDQFTLEVLGDPGGWATVEPAVVPLFPGAEAVARVHFRPPRSSTIAARAYPFAVRVRSREDARASLVEEGVIEVGAFNDTFAELIPRTTRGSIRARSQLALDNRGNVRIVTHLTASDPDRKLNFAIHPPGLTAEPGTASFAQIGLRPRQRFFTGPPRTLPYKVFIHQDGLPPLAVDGAMMQEGLLPGWLLPALLGLLALVILATVLWITVVRRTIASTATEAIASPLAQASSAAEKARSAANTAQSVTNQPLVPGAVPGSNPIGGVAWAQRISATDSAPQLAVPEGSAVAITDLVFENPAGNSGTLRLLRNNRVLFELRLENFRDLDFHFVTPILVNEKQTLTLECRVEQTTPPQTCTAAVYYSGYFRNPPPG